jgi:signal transduction histidine kinase
MIATLLYWATMAVSLANTVLLIWLGLTVLLNAERRTWGIWLASGGLLVGGAFFISHTAILGLGIGSLDTRIDFWWQIGLASVMGLPFGWYVIMLWYTGFWEDRQAALFRRQRYGFAFSALLTLNIGLLMLFANPFPSYAQLLALSFSETPQLFGIPLLILVYPLYTMLTIGLSLDALLHPGPSRRMMGELARRRARPWLIAAAAGLLLVGLLVVIALLVWAIWRTNPTLDRYNATSAIAYFDLAIASTILGSVLCLGQAIVRYEVFTGKTLPQRRFRRHWQNVVLMALGFGAVMSGSLTFNFPGVYSLLLMVILTTLFYALFSQDSYVERQRYIQQLRPFVTSQRLYDRIVTGAVTAELDVSALFQALCGDVLGARTAYLLALGPLAPLVGPPLAYPAQVKAPALSLADLAAQVTSPQTICLPLNPVQYGGATWAIPLWSERGLIGALLLGEKSNGSLYTHEEFEIARASGERLIDTQASTEMARRLMALQRQRLAQSQVIDGRTRRLLHDEVLPGLHSAMLTLSLEKFENAASVVNALATAHRQVADLLHEMSIKVAPQITQLGLMAALYKALNDELKSAFDGVIWTVQPAAEEAIATLPVLVAEVLFYAAREIMRNAARYGRGGQTSRALHLAVTINWRDGLEILIEDDGVGLSAVQPADNAAGSGSGLALHSTMMAVVGGTLSVESLPGQFTRIALTLPREAW